MARILDTITIDAMGGLPTLGTLMGTGVSREVFEDINATSHRSFFGSDFDNLTSDFFHRHSATLESVSREIAKTVNQVMNPDQFRILSSIEDFHAIPPCMEIPILLFEPVRKLHREGRVEGFGYIPDSLPEDNPFQRAVDNMNVDDLASVIDEDGGFELSGTYYSDDPDLDDDQVYAIRKTYDYIRDRLLVDTDRDPTEISLGRG